MVWTHDTDSIAPCTISYDCNEYCFILCLDPTKATAMSNLCLKHLYLCLYISFHQTIVSLVHTLNIFCSPLTMVIDTWLCIYLTLFVLDWLLDCLLLGTFIFWLYTKQVACILPPKYLTLFLFVTWYFRTISNKPRILPFLSHAISCLLPARIPWTII